MVVKTGTSTPWFEVPWEDDDGKDVLVYVRDGCASGTADVLAEALRADGVVRSLYPATVAAEAARLEPGWYGYLDGDPNPVPCDANGTTFDGDVVETTHACVIARVNVAD